MSKFLVRTKSAALVALVAWAAVLVVPGRAAAQSDRPPGLKGYALVQWMDEHRARSSPAVRSQPSRASVFSRTYAVSPQPYEYAQPHAGYVTSYTFARPADPYPAWVAPVRRSCGGR